METIDSAPSISERIAALHTSAREVEANLIAHRAGIAELEALLKPEPEPIVTTGDET